MTGLILLAAGASTRLGKPKQNLQFEGKTLLQRAVQAASDAACSPVILVLSPDSDTILSDSGNASVTVAENREWEEGMASSIRCGLEELLAIEPHITSCIFMVCDQPYVDVTLLNAMVQAKSDSGKGIIACEYGETVGTPVLFDKSYFTHLLELKGQEGAKKIVMKHMQDVQTIPFPLGAVDIDTAADYSALVQKEQRG